MKRSRFSEEQIIGILKEHEAGATAADLSRRHGISDATFHNCRSKYGGTDVSDASPDYSRVVDFMVASVV